MSKTAGDASPGEPVYLGVDVGSTASKAIAFDASGNPVASGVSGYEISRPSQERAEQDARQWVVAVDECVVQLAGQVDLTTIRSVGVTSQVDTHVLVDSQLNPLLPALLWQDVRSSDEADALNARLGEAGRLKGWGDTWPIDASNPVPRALWLARHEPEAWQASRWLLLPKDFVNAWLTGTAGSDPLASFKIVGVDGAYVPGIVHAPGLVDRLPPLRSPEEPVGVTNRTWHGIPAGTTVATATMDAFGNALGSGLRGPGDTMVIMGTSAIVGSIGVGGTSGPGVVNFAPYRGRYLHAGPTQSGGESLRWWARVTGRTLGEVLQAAASASVGSGGVVFAPHLLGERAPLWDNEVRSWFTGMHAGTG
ncbi:MAG: xylulokinase, partial [Acidimicrobiales bacterium]